MCTCKQKSRKPHTRPGYFNYVFTCTTADGKEKEIKIMSTNDSQAKQLAEMECGGAKVPQFKGKEIKASSVDSDEISILAYVEADKEYYYIYPNLHEPKFYKLYKKDIVKINSQSSLNFREELRPLFLVCFRISDIIETTTIGNKHISPADIFQQSPFTAAVLNVYIAFKANGEGTITFNGGTYKCLGKPGVKYPNDLTITTADKYRRKFSNEFGVWMEYAMLIWGQRGIYIHLGYDTLATNSGATQGCIHVLNPQVVDLFNWVTQNTRIQISYPW